MTGMMTHKMDNNPGFFTLQQNQNHKKYWASRKGNKGEPKPQNYTKKKDRMMMSSVCPWSEEFDQDWDQGKRKIVRYIPPVETRRPTTLAVEAEGIVSFTERSRRGREKRGKRRLGTRLLSQKTLDLLHRRQYLSVL
jgi:hypothetical protein